MVCAQLYPSKPKNRILLKNYEIEILTKSLSKLALVGGWSKPSKTASRWAFSRGDLSVSMNLSNSGCDDGSGIAKVANNTRHAILE